MDFHFLILYPSLSVVSSLFLIPLLPPRFKSAGALLIVLVNAVLTSSLVVEAIYQNPTNFQVGGGWIFGELLFRVDALAAWFIVVINVTCLAGGWYGVYYMKAYLSQGSNLSIHWTLFVVFHYAMILVVTAHDGLTFLVAWEIMSMSSFILVMFDYTRFTTLKAGIDYLVQSHIGIILLTVAFIWVWVSEGSLHFTAIQSFLSDPDSFWLFIIFLVGFGFKAGFIPLHTWLPHAHPAAPSHISGIMSGVMVTMGIYGIMRIGSLLTNNLLVTGVTIFFISALTSSYGVLSAAIHRDYKRLLAFSTIENMGIAGLGVGMGLIGKGIGEEALAFLGFSGALLHILNHSLYKPLLFFCSGNLYLMTNTRNMEQLGGLIRKLPYTGFLFLCGAIAIAGLPPFNGFISKFLLFAGMFAGVNVESLELNILMIGGIIGLALVGGLSLLTFSKAFSVIFLGTSRNPSRHQPPEYFSAGYVPLLIILSLMLFIALSPDLVLAVVHRVVAILIPTMELTTIPYTFANSLHNIGVASLLLILLATLIYAARSIAVSKMEVKTGPTWGCGYPAPNIRMQYTGKAFSKSLAKLFAFITSEEKKYIEIPPSTVFPSTRTYQSNYAEFFEKYIVKKVLNQLLNAMNRFSFIHNGRVQYYILYGFLFILLLTIVTFSNIV